ncbi:MAG: nucleotidyltransferase domain-containing protein [Chlorobi bacterium]|nr:nucleotidyltransferase domain-containing protein [Chlorobiota bacterium]
MNKDEKILKSIIAAINKTVPDSEVYLYGSRARGDSGKLSDWDLLILLNSENIPFSLETRLINNLFEVELNTGQVFSPIIYSKNEWKKKYSITPLFKNIEKEGIRIK